MEKGESKLLGYTIYLKLATPLMQLFFASALFRCGFCSRQWRMSLPYCKVSWQPTARWDFGMSGLPSHELVDVDLEVDATATAFATALIDALPAAVSRRLEPPKEQMQNFTPNWQSLICPRPMEEIPKIVSPANWQWSLSLRVCMYVCLCVLTININ